jgi:hypothetical protein
MLIGKAPPAGSSYQLIDGRWVLGLSYGANRSYQNGITAHSGGGKSSAFQLPANVQLFEIDTVAADHDSVLAPAAKQGQIVMVANPTAHILDIYGRGTDTINGVATATAYSVGAGKSAILFCAKDGSWGANLSA